MQQSLVSGGRERPLNANSVFGMTQRDCKRIVKEGGGEASLSSFSAVLGF